MDNVVMTKEDIQFIVNDYAKKRLKDNETYIVGEGYGVILDKNQQYIHIYRTKLTSQGCWVQGVDFDLAKINSNFGETFWSDSDSIKLDKIKDYVDNRFRR